MPALDGTGPRGKGSMTGGARGCCVIPLSNPEQELAFLRNRAKALRGQLDQIEARMRELKAKSRPNRQNKDGGINS